MNAAMAAAGFCFVAGIGFGFLALTLPAFGGLFSLAGGIMTWAAFANMAAAEDE